MLESLKGKQYQLRFSREDHQIQETVFIIIKKGYFEIIQLKRDIKTDNIKRFCYTYTFDSFYSSLISDLTIEAINTYQIISDNTYDNINVTLEVNGEEISWDKGCDDSLLLLLQILDFVAPQQLTSLVNSKNVFFNINDINLKYITLPDIYCFMYENSFRNTGEKSILKLIEETQIKYSIKKQDFNNANEILGIRYRIKPTRNNSKKLLATHFSIVDK